MLREMLLKYQDIIFCQCNLYTKNRMVDVYLYSSKFNFSNLHSHSNIHIQMKKKLKWIIFIVTFLIFIQISSLFFNKKHKLSNVLRHSINISSY